MVSGSIPVFDPRPLLGQEKMLNKTLEFDWKSPLLHSFGSFDESLPRAMYVGVGGGMFL